MVILRIGGPCCPLANPPTAGRAKDANGGVQPDKHDENYASYVINHLLPIEVTVRDPLIVQRALANHRLTRQARM
jgi:hypothetical protein